MASGNSRADSEYANPFGEAKYARGEKPKKPKRSPQEILAQASQTAPGAAGSPVKAEAKPKAEKPAAPKGDIATTLTKLDGKALLAALPKEVMDKMGKRLTAAIDQPRKALVSYDPDYSDDEDGDDSDRDVSSAEYWQDNKSEFMDMVDKDMKSEPIDRKEGEPIKDAAGNTFKVSSVAYETAGKKLHSWSRYEITGG